MTSLVKYPTSTSLDDAVDGVTYSLRPTGSPPISSRQLSAGEVSQLALSLLVSPSSSSSSSTTAQQPHQAVGVIPQGQRQRGGRNGWRKGVERWRKQIATQSKDAAVTVTTHEQALEARVTADRRLHTVALHDKTLRVN
jgi:hypothetical protein